MYNEFGRKDLYNISDAEADEHTLTPAFLVRNRFVLVAYADASFAVTDKLQSISGWILYVNGTHILRGP